MKLNHLERFEKGVEILHKALLDMGKDFVTKEAILGRLAACTFPSDILTSEEYYEIKDFIS